MKNNKNEQLGINVGTAAHRLRKMILFKLVQESGRDQCFRCGDKISSVEELSIEHKVPWLDSEQPSQLFFDLENIAFSHLKCNIRVARKKNKKFFTEEARVSNNRKLNAARMRKTYTYEKRRKKYLTTGY